MEMNQAEETHKTYEIVFCYRIAFKLAIESVLYIKIEIIQKIVMIRNSMKRKGLFQSMSNV